MKFSALMSKARRGDSCLPSGGSEVLSTSNQLSQPGPADCKLLGKTTQVSISSSRPVRPQGTESLKTTLINGAGEMDLVQVPQSRPTRRPGQGLSPNCVSTVPTAHGSCLGQGVVFRSSEFRDPSAGPSVLQTDLFLGPHSKPATSKSLLCK